MLPTIAPCTIANSSDRLLAVGVSSPAAAEGQEPLQSRHQTSQTPISTKDYFEALSSPVRKIALGRFELLPFPKIS